MLRAEDNKFPASRAIVPVLELPSRVSRPCRHTSPVPTL